MPDETKIPKLYLDTVRAMARIVASGAKLQPTPRFTMPPKGTFVAVALCDLPDKARIARNESALYVLETCRAAALRMGGERNEPTLAMLDMALTVAEVPFERVALDALGFEVKSFGSS